MLLSEVVSISEVITSVGPVTASLVFAIFALYKIGTYAVKFIESLNEKNEILMQQQAEQTKQFTEALNRNSSVLQRIYDKLDMGDILLKEEREKS